MSEILSSFQLTPGDAAPDFCLPDADGHVFTRCEVSGVEGLLVVFACNHCPFVVHLAGLLGRFAGEIAKLGVNTVAINANDLERYPQDGPEPMKDFAEKWGWAFPYLLDASQDTAKAYGAACTPDFFLFDASGKLFYTGQFDDSRPQGGLEPNGGDMREAVRRMLDGEEPLVRPYPSSGCSIKWKPGSEPPF